MEAAVQILPAAVAIQYAHLPKYGKLPAVVGCFQQQRFNMVSKAPTINFVGENNTKAKRII